MDTPDLTQNSKPNERLDMLKKLKRSKPVAVDSWQPPKQLDTSDPDKNNLGADGLTRYGEIPGDPDVSSLTPEELDEQLKAKQS